jgi:hypothetical protein
LSYFGGCPGNSVVILGLDPASVAHSGSGQAFADRHWLGFAWSGFLPAAVCPMTSRGRGILADVRIRVASGKQGIQHGETGEDHGVHGDKHSDAKGARPTAARSAQILFCSVDAVVLGLFLRVETLTFCASNAAREDSVRVEGLDPRITLSAYCLPSSQLRLRARRQSSGRARG